MSFTPDATKDFPRHTFVLKVNDRPGAMELIAATFAHRGVSLHALLGNDATMGADSLATVLVTFSAAHAKKEALRGALGRLSRVVSLSEKTGDEETLRATALLSIAGGAALPDERSTPASGCIVSRVASNPTTGETTYAVLGPPGTVDALIQAQREAGTLRAVTQTVLAL